MYYVQNNLSRKYDINTSIDKPLYYRQQFLNEQGLLKKTFKYLEYTQNLNEVYKNYTEKNKKKIDDEKEVEKIKSSINIDVKKPMRKSMKSIEKKNFFDNNNNNADKLILESFKSISKTIEKSFKFIHSMCKNNNNNKKIAFSHKNLFLYYFLEYEEAAKCFMDLLTENENIMNLINNYETKKK